MRKPKSLAENPYLIDLFQARISPRPLFGLNRLVKVQNHKRDGIVHCHDLTAISDSITFSNSNRQTSLYTFAFGTGVPGVVGEPRLNFTPEPAGKHLRQLSTEGTEALVCFRPKRGATYSSECQLYKPVEQTNRAMRIQLPEYARIATYTLTLDLSAYLSSGYSIEGPRCVYESDKANGESKAAGSLPTGGLLKMTDRGAGIWSWSIENVFGGIIRLTWEIERPSDARALKSANLERLATELSVNPRLAKDLHNFVSICHHFAAGIRSLNKIGPAMITNRSVVNRSLETVEQTLGTELIHRTQGKGLIAITPAGHAVLDWWSQYYMRWTPISTEITGP